MSAARPHDERLLTGWGLTSPTRARVHRPRDVTEVVGLVHELGEVGGIARGLGRSYGDAAQAAGGDVVEMTGMDRVLDFDTDAGTITLEAGASLAEVIRRALPRGWFPAVVPGTGDVTVGGAIAADVHGKNHHVDGGFCDHVTGFRLVTGAGDVRDVTPAGDPDLFRATAGGMGLTGIVTEATLRLRPVPGGMVDMRRERTRDLAATMRSVRAAEAEHRYCVAWIDLCAPWRTLGRGVIDAGEHAPGDPAPARIRPRVPDAVPVGLIHRPALRALNAARWHAGRSRRARVPAEAFFHPLDRIGAWNRVYGPGGLVQHQLVVPETEAGALEEIVSRLRDSRCPAALAVLKRFGGGRGMLSFPIPGWTLAVDIPTRWPGLAALLDEVDERVAAAGGRIYLAKDARLRPELVPVMYPELDRWQAVQRRADPGGVLGSDLGLRLGLVGG